MTEADFHQLSLKESAFTYAEKLKWLIVPNKPKSKVPTLPCWTANAYWLKESIERQWEKNPRLNIGILTGQKTGLCILDVDPEHEGDKTLSDLCKRYEDIPLTPTSVTGTGGKHYVFRLPEGINLRNSAGKLGKGLDIRAEGGQFIAPPSLHPNGNKYQWEEGKSPFILSPAPLPGWIIELCTSQDDIPSKCRELSDQDTILKGKRNDTLARIAGGLRDKGHNLPEITIMLLEVNHQRCKPPLSDKEVKGIAESINRYAPTHSLTERPLKDSNTNLLSLLQSPDPEKAKEVDNIGGLLYRGYLNFLISDPGAGKTFLTLRLACDLSRGGEIFDGFDYSEPMKVLFLAGEGGEYLLNLRLKDTKWSFDPDYFKIVSLDNAEQQGMILCLSDAKGRENLEQLVIRFMPDVVILDTLTAFHHSKENESSEMKPVIEYLRRIAVDYDLALLANHHARKRKTSEVASQLTQHESIGTSIFNRYTGNMIGIETKTQGEGKYQVVKSLKTWFIEFQPFSFTIEDDEEGNPFMRFDLDPSLTDSKRSLVWQRITSNFEPGEEFTKAKIVQICSGIVSKPYIDKCFIQWTSQGKLAKTGITKDSLYFLPEITPKAS